MAKRSDNNERTIFIRNKISEIRNLNANLIQELEILGSQEEIVLNNKYTFEDYQRITGKRFRLSKEAKEQGFTREEALDKFFTNFKKKNQDG